MKTEIIRIKTDMCIGLIQDTENESTADSSGCMVEVEISNGHATVLIR
jgi:hypothetical protein